MRISLKSIILICIFISGFAASGLGQSSSSGLKTEVDTIIAAAYKSASAKFPCKLKAKGKAKMLRWQDVEECVNAAFDRVDWTLISKQLREIREKERYASTEMTLAIEDALTAHALPYSEVFLVKEQKALLPLSNSLLKFLPNESLVDLPVYSKSGTKIGVFAGIYRFEKYGAISGNKYLRSLFQYTDLKGKMQTPSDKLLLDSFGVPWKDAVSQPGFRLPEDKLIPKN
jgi:hypothetical protein